ncbi:MAG: efflux RND transporter permease subunit [Deltaproteobacteria bacterium]|nr:efflux RND transporter permease subunit [Deltaproteobacteria bacterium]
MKLSETAIRRPVLASVMSIIIVLFGMIALFRLPVRQYPDVDPPIVSVTTIYPGANPRVVETEVTEPLEEQINGIEGIRTLVSQSREQVSTITVEFTLDRDVDVAAQDVRDRVLRTRNQLPNSIEEPIIAKQDADASPIMWIGLSGARYTALDLTDYADNVVKERLEILPGVSSIIIGGERKYAMRLWIDAEKLAAYQLTVADVSEALRRENVDIPSGRIEGIDREFTVRTLGEMRSAEEFNAMIIANRDGQPIRIRDVGNAELGAEDDRNLVRFNGKPAVGLGVVKQSKANSIEVAKNVKKAVEQTRSILPTGLEMVVAFDSSIFIEDSIREVKNTLLLAGFLVILVIFLFLRTLRGTLIPAITIPVSVIGTFTMLYALDYTINIITLLGLTLSIGLVVDDAIIVLENIYRRVEAGQHPMKAALDGMREIGFAVIATTVALVAVFTPLAFMTGTTGRLFREFGVTLSVAVIISTFVALTLSPALSARILKKSARHGRFYTGLERGFVATADAYQRLLRRAVSHPALMMTVAGIWIGLAVFLVRVIPREFIPSADSGSLFVFAQAPEGSTLEYTNRYMHQAEAVMQAQPEIDKLFSVIALGLNTPGEVNSGAMFAMLKPRDQRERSSQQIVQELFPMMMGIPGMLAFPINPPSLGQSFLSQPVEFVIQGPNLSELAQINGAVLGEAFGIPGLINVDSDLKLNKPELEVEIDRNRASDLGVSVRDVATTLQILLGGEHLSDFKRGAKQYEVKVQLRDFDRVTPSDLERLYVRGAGGQVVQLSSLLKVKESVAPRQLNHYQRQRAAKITGSVAPGFALGGILDQLQAIADKHLRPGFSTALAGQSREFKESANALYFAFLLSIIVIYLTLSAQFESFLHPLTILFTVPLAVTGAFVGLIVTGNTLNLFSEIGLVMLTGLVTKNAILIVEFANQLRTQGSSLIDATVEACRLRFRPILMTTVSTIFGTLPIALGLGAGGESRAPMGVAVIGGLFFSALISLLAVPVVYILLDNLSSFVAGRAADRKVAGGLFPATPPRPGGSSDGG